MDSKKLKINLSLKKKNRFLYAMCLYLLAIPYKLNLVNGGHIYKAMIKSGAMKLEVKKVM